jgi:hypothetical protein
MTPGVRKLALTAHVCTSVGWLGAVAGFLALAVTGLGSLDAERVRAVCVSMDVVAWFVILPACLASLVTGVVQSLGTPWGLLRHHWTVAKLFITVVSTIILLVHMRPISLLGRMASRSALGLTELHDVRLQLAMAAGGAVLALLVATALSVYKPKGLTSYGQRMQTE